MIYMETFNMIFEETENTGAFSIEFKKVEDSRSFFSCAWHLNALADKKGAK